MKSLREERAWRDDAKKTSARFGFLQRAVKSDKTQRVPV